MAPGWLTVMACVYLSVCFCCASIISYDIVVNHRRQPMGVMNLVFPITALYFGPLALALYWRWGRATAQEAMTPMPMRTVPPSRAAVISAGDVMQMQQDEHAHHGIDGAAALRGAARPASSGEQGR